MLDKAAGKRGMFYDDEAEAFAGQVQILEK